MNCPIFIIHTQSFAGFQHKILAHFTKIDGILENVLNRKSVHDTKLRVRSKIKIYDIKQVSIRIQLLPETPVQTALSLQG